MKKTHVFTLALAVAMFAASSTQAQTFLPKPDPPFKGQTGRKPEDSTKSFPAPVAPPPNAPNILLILTDDVGFGASDTFGGPIATPAFSRIANAGLRFNQFHTTALCSPTRAALLTGRNHHSVATGSITECGTGYPGYTTVVPQNKRGRGDILKLNGCNIATDFSQASNLVVTVPQAPDPATRTQLELHQKLQKLEQRFYIEAVKYDVLPLDYSKTSRFDTANRPSNIEGVTQFPYSDEMIRIPEGSAPDLKNKPFSITAEVTIPTLDAGETANGVLMTQGGRFAGLGLYLKDGKPVFHYNNCDWERTSVVGALLAPGDYEIKVDFKYEGGVGGAADIDLTVTDGDGDPVVVTGAVGSSIPYRVSLDETLDIGEDTGTSVNPADYGGEGNPALPFKFNGTLQSVTIEYTEPEAEMTPADRLKYHRGRARAAAAH